MLFEEALIALAKGFKFQAYAKGGAAAAAIIGTAAMVCAVAGLAVYEHFELKKKEFDYERQNENRNYMVNNDDGDDPLPVVS